MMILGQKPELPPVRNPQAMERVTQENAQMMVEGQQADKKVTRRQVLSAGVTLGLLGAAAGLTVMGAQGWKLGPEGLISPQEAAGTPPADAPVWRGENGQEYVDNSANGLMAQAVGGEDGYYFAPMPLYENQTYQGPWQARGFSGAEAIPAGSWVMPGIQDVSGQSIASSYTEGSFAYIPDSLPGVMSTGVHSVLSVGLDATEGSAVLAGHVNQRSSGYLSDWGYLHRAKPGDQLILKRLDGVVQEYLVHRVYVRRQGSEFVNDQTIWARTGQKMVNLVTCAGAYVGADGTNSWGGTLLFPYTHNLVVEAYAV